MDPLKIPMPADIATQLTEFILPFIGMMCIVVIAFMIKDLAMKFSKGLAFSMNKAFQEGDKVILDGERALIVKIGLTQTVFGITKDGGVWDGDYVWRYVPNERIPYIKLEKVVFDHTPHNNAQDIQANSEQIKEIKNGR